VDGRVKHGDDDEARHHRARLGDPRPLASNESDDGHSVKVQRDHRPGLPAVFAAFFWLGVTRFGGNRAAWLYRQIVQRRHWVTGAEFLSGVALGRTTPGSGGVNLTVLIGQRLGGSRGAAVAVVALLSGPLAIVLVLAAGYTRIRGGPALHGILDGVAAAAIGLTFATGLTFLRWRRAEIGPLTISLAPVLCVGVLRWPMIPVVLCLAPISIGLAMLTWRSGNA
jgi:chromate transporter